jgi:hypothetical protein
MASHGQRSSDRRLFSCPMPQRQAHVVNRDGARRYHRLIQSKIVVTRPPPIFPPLHQPFPHGIQLFQQAMPSPSGEEPTVRKALTVACPAFGYRIPLNSSRPRTFGPTCSRNPTPEAIAPSTSFTPAMQIATPRLFHWH